MTTQEYDLPNMFETSCGNGHKFFVFADEKNWMDFHTVCRICQGKVYVFRCSKCRLEFDIPEGSGLMEKYSNRWKCEACGHSNSLASGLDCVMKKNYLKEEIPLEIWGRHKNDHTRISPDALSNSILSGMREMKTVLMMLVILIAVMLFLVISRSSLFLGQFF